MNSYRFTRWLRQLWHPSDEDWLLYMDDELSPRSARRVRKHLMRCWFCRVTQKDIEQSIHAVIKYRRRTLDSQSDVLSGDASKADRRFASRLHQLAVELETSSNSYRRLERVIKQYGFTRLSIRLATSLLVLCLVLFAFARLSSVPSVSAQQVLAQSERAEIQRGLGATDGVIYQKLWVQRSSPASASEVLTWEIWNDTGRGRFESRVEEGNEAVLTRLEQIFESNNLDPVRPLSSVSYAVWRNSIGRRAQDVEERRLAEGTKALVLTARAEGPVALNGIIQNQLFIRAGDWLPVELRLRAQEEDGIGDYRLVETDYRLVALDAVPPSIFAGRTPPPPPPTTAPDLAGPDPLDDVKAETIKAGAVAIEIQANYLLHRLKACLGEPIEVIQGPSGIVEVHGLAESAERKAELLAALQELPQLKVKIQTIEEAVRASSEAAGATAVQIRAEPVSPAERAVRISAMKTPVHDQLERYFIEQENHPESGEDGAQPARQALKMTDFVNQVISLSDAALAEAWALRRLAESYPNSATAELPVAARWLLEMMVRDHISALRTHLDQSLRLLQPVLVSLPEFQEGAAVAAEAELPGGLAAAMSAWSADVLRLFSEVRRAQQLVTWLLAGNALPEGEDENPVVNLGATFHQAQRELGRLESQMDQEFFGRRDSSAPRGQLRAETEQTEN